MGLQSLSCSCREVPPTPRMLSLMGHLSSNLVRWAKGGTMIEDAKESKYETQVDYTFFTEPVSCEVRNDVGSTNVSTLVDVHCEWEARLPRPRQERAAFLGKPRLLPAAPPTFSHLGPWSPLGPLREKGWLPCHLLLCSPLLVAPRIVVDPKPLTTDIGSDVTLTCVWTGNPPLTLTWAKKESNMVRSLLAPEDQIWGWGLKQLFLRSSSSLGWGLHPSLNWVLSGEGEGGKVLPHNQPSTSPPPPHQRHLATLCAPRYSATATSCTSSLSSSQTQACTSARPSCHGSGWVSAKWPSLSTVSESTGAPHQRGTAAGGSCFVWVFPKGCPPGFVIRMHSCLSLHRSLQLLGCR